VEYRKDKKEEGRVEEGKKEREKREREAARPVFSKVGAYCGLSVHRGL